MKISQIRLQNFRAFRDAEFSLDPYSCLVGANGAGKSTVLAALNVFFREQAVPGLDAMRLNADDFHLGDTSEPVRITLQFTDLGAEALAAFADYARHDELVVSAVAHYDETAGSANVQHFGQRLGMNDFRYYFGQDEGGARATDLEAIYDELRERFGGLPEARTKALRIDALRAYEDSHPELCELIPSQDVFYGANSTGKLARFVQWIYVPAVKDVGQEGIESKSSALGKLIRRTVGAHVDVEERLHDLEADTINQYQAILDENRAGLQEVASAIERRLAEWAHPDVHLEIDWLNDARTAIRLQSPAAGVRAGDGSFLANLDHLGHGLQRSYLLAILQELAASEAPEAPTLLLGCEEPELYQHPPQARYLSEVFQSLAAGNNQVIVTTHSPLFVTGSTFTDVRLVRRERNEPVVSAVQFDRLCERIRVAGGLDPGRPVTGMAAKIAQGLQPHIAEFFFTQVPILVEGLEDVAYLTAQLHLSGRWADFRRLGCHLIAANGKDRLIQPVAIARELNVPAYLIFDADGDNDRPDQRPKHEKDNQALLNLMGSDSGPFPDVTLIGPDFTVWPTNLTDIVKAETGITGESVRNRVRAQFDNEGGLEKNSLFIAEWLTLAHDEGCASAALVGAVDRLLAHAQQVAAARGG